MDVFTNWYVVAKGYHCQWNTAVVLKTITLCIDGCNDQNDNTVMPIVGIISLQLSHRSNFETRNINNLL